MKKLKYLLIALGAIFTFFACEDDFKTPPAAVNFTNVAPVLTDAVDNVTDTLYKKNEDATWDTLSWNIADYVGDELIIHYAVQIDDADGDFDSPFEIKAQSDVEATIIITVKDLNTALLANGYSPVQEYNLKLRIKASVHDDLETVYSEEISPFTVTTYKDVPVPDALYLFGDATTALWDAAASLATYKEEGKYTVFTYLETGKEFRFLKAQAEESSSEFIYNYNGFAEFSDNVENGGGDNNNIKFTGETGWYKIEADFILSKLTIALHVVGTTTYGYDYENLYIVGDYSADDPVWDEGNAVAMTKGEGVFTIQKVLKDGAQFKFIGQQSWGDLDWGNIGENGNSGTLGAKDFNGNITYDGADGTYNITVNLKTGTYTIEAASFAIYIVGDATTVGWNIDDALEMNYISTNLWTGSFTLEKDEAFKFFPKKGSWDNGIGSDGFDNFVGSCEAVDDGNFKFTGETGEYVVYVDVNTKTVTVFDKPYMVGGSVSAGWTPENGIAATKTGAGTFEIYAYFVAADGGFKFLPTNTGWDGDFGASKVDQGVLVQDDEDNMVVAEDGFHRVTLDYTDMTYAVTKIDWGLIGSATSGGWEHPDTDLTFTGTKGDYTWTVTTDLVIGEIKFRANDGWDINFGDTGVDGTLEAGGDNIAIAEDGNYTITMTLHPVNGYTYTVVKN